jgi:hypothetical protein
MVRSMTTPICSTCKDTHRMTLTRDGHEDQIVMCTHCPVPCQRCRENGTGPFCGTTPCTCDCHASHPSYQKPSWVTEHKETGCPLPFGHDPPCRPDLMRRSVADPVPGLREAAQLIFQMTEIYQHNPEALRALEDVRGAVLRRAGRDPKEQGSARYLDERRPSEAKENECNTSSATPSSSASGSRSSASSGSSGSVASDRSAEDKVQAFLAAGKKQDAKTAFHGAWELILSRAKDESERDRLYEALKEVVGADRELRTDNEVNIIEKCRGLVSRAVSVQSAFEALTVLAVQARARRAQRSIEDTPEPLKNREHVLVRGIVLHAGTEVSQIAFARVPGAVSFERVNILNADVERLPRQDGPLPGALTLEELRAACNTIGYDITCGACAMRFFTGFTLPTSRADMLPPDHEATCKTDISYLAADPIEVTNEPR